MPTPSCHRILTRSPLRPPETRSLPVRHCQTPRKRFGLHVHRHDEPAAIRQGYLNLTARRWTGINRICLRRGSSLRHGDRREQYRATRPGHTVAILPPPGGQQRSANAMPPRCGGRPTVADKALFHTAQFIIIRPIPPAITIGSRQNVDLRAVDKAGHKVGLTIGSNPRSHRRRQRLTLHLLGIAVQRGRLGQRIALTGIARTVMAMRLAGVPAATRLAAVEKGAGRLSDAHPSVRSFHVTTGCVSFRVRSKSGIRITA